MKIYRIHCKQLGRGVDGESLGYRYEPSMRLAKDFLKSLAPESEGDIEEIQVGHTKKSVIAALNRYAGHPDNG